MKKTFIQGKDEIAQLCKYFASNHQEFLASGIKEAHVRSILIDPFFEALGWDVRNTDKAPPQDREVMIEDSLDVEGHQKAPDYSFRIGTMPKFYAEAKKCGINISTDPGPAYQLRRYGWSAKVAMSVLTDFEEFSIYDCTKRPNPKDKASYSRMQYYHFEQYPDRWREIWDVFSREAVWSGAFDKHTASKRRRGTSEVDTEFLKEIEGWRDVLARNIALRNKDLSSDDLNAAVQRTIDRIVFLRMAEDRGIEPYEQLLKLCERPEIYPRFMRDICTKADQKYNSGLFHFQKEKGISEAPDQITPRLKVDDKAIKPILQNLYFSHGSPYHFGVLPVEILGTVYERFLGKVIRLTAGHQAKIEEKPEVRKAGGVYYTPSYIVDYIVEHTVGAQINGKSPSQLARGKNKEPFRILDMACGSGSFLLGAYKYLLDHCLKWYIDHNPSKHKKAVYKDSRNNQWRLTILEKKRILTTHIYGVDIDPQAVEVSKLSLLLKVLESETDQTIGQQMQLFQERALPNLIDNIKCGNSIIGTDILESQLFTGEEERKLEPMNFEDAFPKVIERGGFDAIVGNPPYRMLQPHNTSAQLLAYLRSHYIAAEFKIDLFHLFLQRATSLIKDGGYLGYIVPTTILNNVYAETLRGWLMDHCCIEQISVARGRVFADADVHTSVLVFRREPLEHIRKTHVALTTSELNEEFVKAPLFHSKTRQTTFNKLPGRVWNILVNDRNVKLISRLTTDFVSLGVVAKINRGLITGNRNKYFAQTKNTKHHVPIIAGSDVNRYYTIRPSEYVLFERPKTAGGCWDEKVHFAPHKLVIRQICKEPTASIIKIPIAVTGNIFTVRADSIETEIYLLGIINSKLISYFWRTMFADFKASFPQVTIFSLSQVPIRKLDISGEHEKGIRDEMLVKVEMMLDAKTQLAEARTVKNESYYESKCSTLNRQIDNLVYSLYGLTKEEIAIVEGNQS